MQKANQNFNKFYKQSLRQSQIIKAQDLQKQIQTLRLLKQQQYFEPNQKQQLQKYIKTYSQSVKQLKNLQTSFTKPSLINPSISQIFTQNIQSKQQLAKNSLEKNTIAEQYKQLNKLSLYQYPSFKKPSNRSLHNNNQNNGNIQEKELNSPELRLFFQKKQNEIQKTKATKSNFKDIIKNDQYRNSNLNYHNNSHSSKDNNFNQNINITSLSNSRQHHQPTPQKPFNKPSNISSSQHSSQSSASIRHRSHNLTQQFKKSSNKIVQQNNNIKKNLNCNQN